MLQDKAKVTIELDVESAKKQLNDTKQSLHESAEKTTRKIEETTNKIKNDEKKEVDRQSSALSDKLRRIAEMPQRLIAPDVPERLLGAAAGIPYIGNFAPAASFVWRERDNIEILKALAGKGFKDIPILEQLPKLIELGTKPLDAVGIDANKIRELKAEWESISKTLEDVIRAFTGTIMSGQNISPLGSKSFISRLYQYNTNMSLLDKNRRFLQQNLIGSRIGDILNNMIPGRD